MAPVADSASALPLWVASIPDPFTPQQGQEAAQRALDDADTVIFNIKARFSGTLPPPPWPATADLKKAIGDVEIARDAFEALANHSQGVALKWPKSTGKVGPTLVRVGTTLYQQLAALEAKAATSDTLPDLVAKLKDLPRPFALPAGLLLLGLGYVAWREWRNFERLLSAA